MKKTILTFLLLSSVFISSAQLPSNGLKAYYPFNGNANDSSGNAINPANTVNIAYGADRFGVAGKALYLNNPTNSAATSYVEFAPTHFSFAGAFSFSVWFYNEYGFYNPRIIEIGVDGCGFNFGLNSDQRMYFYHKCQGGRIQPIYRPTDGIMPQVPMTARVR